MKTCKTYMLVAAMAVAGLGMSTLAADMTSSTDNTGAQMQQTGSQMADQSTAKEIRSALAKTVNDGLEKNKFNSFVSYLAKGDRDRVGSVSKSNLDSLNSTLDQFRQDFKSKYNQEFDISADNIKDAMIYAGQDKKSATVSFANPAQSGNQAMDSGNTTGMNSTNTSGTNSNNASVMNSSNTSGMDSSTSGANTNKPTEMNPNMSGSNNTSGMNANNAPAMNSGNTPPMNSNNTSAMNSTNTPSGNSMTTANNAAMASLTLNLINEGHVMNEWRINAPQVSLEQIKQNLTRHIQMLDDQKAAWPSDVNQAYQAVAYHVLEAFNDTTVASDR